MQLNSLIAPSMLLPLMVACGSEGAVGDAPVHVVEPPPPMERMDEEYESHEGPCSREGTELADLVNEFRRQNGLPAVPMSVSLCRVAETHLDDILVFAPYNDGEDCALQSWSENTDGTGCCYASDHSNAECMWNKPSELTEYPALGYESVAINTLDPEDAMNHLTNLSGHVELILEQKSFDHVDWHALGAAYRDGVAIIWFGDVADPVVE